jgi:CheY-like chemotaxis protein
MIQFSGVRVLLVEDEGTVAMMIEDMLAELGCELVASVGSLAKALRIASDEQIDVAILDVNVAGEPVFVVAEVLRGRGVPILFSTGYGAVGIGAEFKCHPVLGKPFSQTELQQMLALTLERDVQSCEPTKTPPAQS